MADTGTTVAPPVGGAAENATNGTGISPEGSILAYSSLYTMAVFCIYVGSLRSVTFVRKHKTEKKKIENSIGWKDARLFPLTASAVLFGLYCVFKYNDQITTALTTALAFVKNKGSLPPAPVGEVANVTGNASEAGPFTLKKVLSKDNFGYLLLVLLCWEGCFALAHLIKPAVSALLRRLPLKPDSSVAQNLPYKLLLTRAKAKGSHEQTELINWDWDAHDLCSIALCSVVGVAHIYWRHWITNNIIGVSFSLYGIEALHLGSFKAGAMLLAGLFVYDVFWVFATDVMATVATSVKAPILLLFPQDLLTNGWEAKKFAMLGLGDIVIPGIFLALLLRFGTNEDEDGKPAREGPRRIYFYATVGGYCLGLVITIAVMHYFKAAQPALLYLVPACLGVPLLLAALKGQTKELTQFSEEHLVKQEEKEKAKDE